MGIERNIQAGDFLLSPTLSSRELAELLTHGAIDVWVTLPEGLRIEEQAELIEQVLKLGSAENYNFNRNQFIDQAVEGYMFPDTYLIPKDGTAAQIIEKLRSTFKSKIEEDILNQFKSDFSKEDIIILASLVEREARSDEQRKIIAGILLNRLNNGIALQVDATVQYAKGYDSANDTWWPQITQDDYINVDSAYNTYQIQGLPPAPIASPGISAIKAVLDPKDTNYLYYLHDSKGEAHYAETLEGHNQNVQDFL